MSRIITIFARKLFKMTDELIEIIIEGLQDSKARDIRVIDMRQLDEAAFQYFVVCEGTSSTHVLGIANKLIDYVEKKSGQHRQGVVGLQNRQWVAIDYGYLLVHIFQRETRDFYRLESLWEDAKITQVPDLDYGTSLLIANYSLLIIHYHWVLNCVQYPMISPSLSA